MAIKSVGEEGMSLSVLPEGCIAKVLSFTGPTDACRLSIVSSLFKSAEESDAVWERFLPRDYQSIIFTSDSSVLLASLSSKKELYLRLCEKPIIIDDGKKVTLMSISPLFFLPRLNRVELDKARTSVLRGCCKCDKWHLQALHVFFIYILLGRISSCVLLLFYLFGLEQSFSLVKKSGKKCYMLSARDLMIVWGDTPCYWRWNSDSSSRLVSFSLSNGTVLFIL